MIERTQEAHFGRVVRRMPSPLRRGGRHIGRSQRPHVAVALQEIMKEASESALPELLHATATQSEKCNNADQVVRQSSKLDLQ